MVVESSHMQRRHPILVPGHGVGMVTDQLLDGGLMPPGSSVVERGQPLGVLGAHLAPGLDEGTHALCLPTVRSCVQGSTLLTILRGRKGTLSSEKEIANGHQLLAIFPICPAKIQGSI